MGLRARSDFVSQGAGRYTTASLGSTIVRVRLPRPSSESLRQDPAGPAYGAIRSQAKKADRITWVGSIQQSGEVELLVTNGERTTSALRSVTQTVGGSLGGDVSEFGAAFAIGPASAGQSQQRAVLPRACCRRVETASPSAVAVAMGAHLDRRDGVVHGQDSKAPRLSCRDADWWNATSNAARWHPRRDAPDQVGSTSRRLLGPSVSGLPSETPRRRIES